MSNHELMSSMDDQTLAQIMSNKRHKSAKSQFRNPPQPRFCIRETEIQEGRPVFINVLSYSRIANQLSEFDPIPLYGGMLIRSYSSFKNAAHIQQSPPQQLIFAVMASPDVLKKTGRNSDSPEQMNLVELMCEFVEAMNPTIVLSKKPEILKDRDLAGELKDVWTAVQNFRDKEKAFSSGGQDIVVYTEFGPDSAQPIPIHRNDPNIGKPVKSEIYEASNLDQQTTTDTQNHEEKDEVEENVVEKEKCEEISVPEKVVVDDSNSQSIEIDKLSLGGSDKKVISKPNENHLSNESSEKNVKIQNQKNKESQHHFFPKFLSSSKEKEAKDKEKEKEKVEIPEPEPKTKTKKSFFSLKRNKSQSSPTHTASNNNLNNQKSDSEP